MLLMIDNYDSFTYNLVQYLSLLGEDVLVKRNNMVTIPEILDLAPGYMVLSPGPGIPDEAGIMLQAIQQYAGKMPILGVCLGLQAIGRAFGGRVVKARTPMHGKISLIYHDGQSVFAGLPSPFKAVRYHSLIVERETLPAELEVTAWTEEGEIMGLRHLHLPVEGVQFHPESMLSEYGLDLLANFLKGAGLN
ncbi:anthranilate synthase component 2 [Desulfotomaculum arcticum]|uniref:Anthranilate synthase component 2 n=1 Tax=Desulfotruncus arcticus DSM 17038 TaxID=1121424 RepID=A0A1I2QBG4_9FIRM|nr:aminodeoxychorismate/anthranilate synthase component II [Desulfotruncus arcticus]SFG24719.1 anthranilate synthase component 2 [Desulfotomaculum arcticum] [Desulfotruncus arcticus DSM 17038]